MLEQVRLLSNIELDNRKLINIFFVGQTEFNRTLLDERCKALRQRITVSYHIEPLTEAEVRQYILHRLKVAGARREIFTPDAIRRVHAFSRGYPRLINIICDHALLTGYASGIQTIDLNLIRECEKELRVLETRAATIQEPQTAAAQEMETSYENPASPKPLSWRFPALVVFLILLGFTAFMVYQDQTDKPQRWATEELAPQSYKGLSGKPIPSETEEPPEAKPAPSAPPPIAVAPAGSPLEAVSPDSLRINPFAKGKIIIFFPYNSNELRKDVLASLDQIAAFLKTEKRLKVQIAGYTDGIGAVTYNITVSQFRANSVKSYLAGKGVDPGQYDRRRDGPQGPDRLQ